MRDVLWTIGLAVLLAGQCLPAPSAEPEQKATERKEAAGKTGDAAGDPAAGGGREEKKEAQPGDQDRRQDPFAPSPLMRERARRASALPPAGGVAEAAAEGAPVLEGLIVRGKSVLACFRIGRTSVMAEPGEKFGPGELRYTFVKYEGETVTLQDRDGNARELKACSRRPPGQPGAQGGDQP